MHILVVEAIYFRLGLQPSSHWVPCLILGSTRVEMVLKEMKNVMMMKRLELKLVSLEAF